MGNKVKILIVLMFFLLIGVVSAQPPFQESGTLHIEYSKLDVVKQSTDHNFHFHVFNDTSLIDNSTASCGITLVIPNGTFIYRNSNIPFLVNSGNEWAITLDGGNFSTIGEYSYVAECNTTTEVGFSSIGFEVNGVGQVFSTAKSITYSSFLLLFVFLFVANFFGIGLLPDRNTKDEEGKIMSISMLKYVRTILWFVQYALFVAILFLSSNLAFAYLGETLFAQAFFVLFRISLGIAPLILAVTIAWFFVKIIEDKKLKEYMSRGLYSGSKL